MLIVYLITGIIFQLINWKFVIPSQNKNAQEQSVIDGRSPLFELVAESKNEIIELKNEIIKLQKVIGELQK